MPQTLHICPIIYPNKDDKCRGLSCSCTGVSSCVHAQLHFFAPHYSPAPSIDVSSRKIRFETGFGRSWVPSKRFLKHIQCENIHSINQETGEWSHLRTAYFFFCFYFQIDNPPPRGESARSPRPFGIWLNAGEILGKSLDFFSYPLFTSSRPRVAGCWPDNQV